MKHVMIDLETFGTCRNAVIIALAAVFFDPTVHGAQRSDIIFYRNIDADSCLQCGLQMDVDTLYWWARQPKEAGELVSTDRYPLRSALQDFSFFIDQHEEDDQVQIWSHATFDYGILQHAFEACQLPWPFKFWQARDIRTLESLTRIPKPDFVGTKHYALDDCHNQIHHVVNMLHEIQKWREGYHGQ